MATPEQLPNEPNVVCDEGSDGTFLDRAPSSALFEVSLLSPDKAKRNPPPEKPKETVEEEPPDSWRKRAFRYATLFFICFLTFGDYYVYDMPGALTPSAIEEYFNVTAFQYELLYSLYSWPNTVLAAAGGVLIDKLLGVRLGACIFVGLVVAGQLIFSIATSGKYWTLAVFGRFVYGLGGECVSVAQSTYCAQWFRGRELALAFAITISMARIGSALNFYVTPFLSQHYRLPVAAWFGLVACTVSIVSCISLWVLDIKGVRKGFKPSSAFKVHGRTEWNIRKLVPPLWVIYGIVVSYYIGVFIFITIGSDFFVQKFGYSDEEAGRFVGIPYSLAAVASPLFGLLTDRVGFNLSWMMLSCSLLTGTHLLMALSSVYPLVPMIFMGISYSMLAASLWPCVSFLVVPTMQGTAYGIAYAIQNTGLAVAPMVIGEILRCNDNNYESPIWVFVGCAGVSVMLAVSLSIWDFFSGGVLNKSRRRMLAALRERDRVEETESLIGLE